MLVHECTSPLGTKTKTGIDRQRLKCSKYTQIKTKKYKNILHVYTTAINHMQQSCSILQPKMNDYRCVYIQWEFSAVYYKYKYL